jgi:hypothetical protein
MNTMASRDERKLELEIKEMLQRELRGAAPLLPQRHRRRWAGARGYGAVGL